jgi:hypothetical protein
MRLQEEGLILSGHGLRHPAPVDAALLKAKAMVEQRGEDWPRLLQQLIQIPSRFEAEHEIVDSVSGYVKALGITPILVPMAAAVLLQHADATEPFSAPRRSWSARPRLSPPRIGVPG